VNRAHRQLGRIAAVARRDLQIERSYSLRFVLRAGTTVVGILISYQTGMLVVDAPQLAQWRGSYFDFVMVGFAVLALARLGIGGFKQAVNREMSAGTMEVLLATPTPSWALLTGAVMFPALLTGIELCWFIGLGLGVIGGGFTGTGLALAVPMLLLTLGSFCAFGIVGAAFVVVTKRGDPVTMLVGVASSVLAGALVPLETFPAALQALAKVFPAYYAIRGTRIALLTDASVGDVAPYALGLLAYDVVLLTAAVWVFRRGIDLARTAGTLGSY
jgi:ABC-2 type transport system permease protein